MLLPPPPFRRPPRSYGHVMVDSKLVALRRDGAVCIRGAFTDDGVALVAQGIDRSLADPGELALVASRPDDRAASSRTSRGWQRIPEYEKFIRESAAAQIAGELMGSRQVRLFHDHVLVKGRRRVSRRRGIGTSRTTASAAGGSARSGCPSTTQLTASRLSSSSPARTRSVAHAEDVHGRGGEVSPREPSRTCLTSRAIATASTSSRGSSSRRLRLLPHADAPRSGWSYETAAGALDPLPRR